MTLACRRRRRAGCAGGSGQHERGRRQEYQSPAHRITLLPGCTRRIISSAACRRPWALPWGTNCAGAWQLTVFQPHDQLGRLRLHGI